MSIQYHSGVTTNYDFDIRAFDSSKVAETKKCIYYYVTSIKNLIKNIEAASGKVDYAKAFAGETQINSIKSYIERSVAKMNSIIEELSDFNSALSTVKGNYEKETVDVASKVGAKQKEVTDKEIIKAHTGVQGFQD